MKSYFVFLSSYQAEGWSDRARFEFKVKVPGGYVWCVGLGFLGFRI